MTCWLCGCKRSGLATNEEAPTCKDGPCQTCRAVADVDEEINQAVATLRRLLVKRCDLRSEQNRVHGTLIHRLPVELKNYIFELLLPSRSKWGEILRSETPSKIVMPSFLTSICRSWRDTAWSNPLLWSEIHIAVGTQVPTSDTSSRINFVHDWIMRSQTFPLTLHIVVHGKNGLKEESKGVIDAISQCSNRWHSLSLHIPLEMLRTFRHSNLQCHLLKRLLINCKDGLQGDSKPLAPFLNPTANPESITVRGVSPQSLQISWNNLTLAQVECFNLEEITQLFQHASHMTHCYIFSPRRGAPNFSMPPIIYQSLISLGLYNARGLDAPAMPLGSLTLPRLEKFYTDDMGLLNPAYLPALVQRSSCPLTKIHFSTLKGKIRGSLSDLQPFPGIVELVVEGLDERKGVLTENLLLGEYFPDLRYLTLHLEPFLLLWGLGVISKLLDRRHRRPGVPDGGRPPKLIAIYGQAVELDRMWESAVGKELKALSVGLRKNGFVFL